MKSDIIKRGELLARPNLLKSFGWEVGILSKTVHTDNFYVVVGCKFVLPSLPPNFNSLFSIGLKVFPAVPTSCSHIFGHICFLLSNAFKVRPEAFASTLILPLVYFCPCLRTKTGIVDFKKSLKNLSSRFLRLMPRNVEIQVQSNFNFRLFIHKNFNASDYFPAFAR